MAVKAIAHSYWRSIKRGARTFDGVLDPVTVSYTHLDVYKRQDTGYAIPDFYKEDESCLDILGEAIQQTLLNTGNIYVPVSYTHLDVYKRQIQANNGIQNFEAEDVTVEPGEAIDVIVVNLAIQPVDSVEKIYVTITVN